MKVLIIGSNGQLGRQMQKALTLRNIDFAAFDYPDIDITDQASVEKLIKETAPSAVVNCAAYTNVDQAETDTENAYRINALGAKILSEVCAQKDIEIVHVSTDYVFSGDPVMLNGMPRPYLEEDDCHPVTAYGRTKLEGERFVQQSGAKAYILRTAWLYGDGNNFVRTMLKLAEYNDTVRVVNDQFGSPTSTVDLAEAICALIGTGAYGLYHATCEGQCSWYEFAKKIFELSDIKVNVIPVTSEEFVRPAKRPAWSVLDNAQLKHIGKNVFRHWEDALKDYLGK
jgi:dTDP-4-dehydrorhamnose reductase